MNTTLKNYYIIGKVMGGQRTENLIKFLLDKQQPVYYNSLKNNKSIPSFFYVLLSKISNFLNMIMADVVIMPAMCNNYQFEFKLAVFLKKEIITDFYYSLYDTHVLDKKPVGNGEIVYPDSRLAAKFKEIDRKIINKSNITFFLNKTEAIYYLKILNIIYDPKKHLILPICSENKLKCRLNYYSNKTHNVFNICWWGSYIPLHGLEYVIQSAKILKDNYNLNFHLHLFGNNEEKSKYYKNLIMKLELSGEVSIHNDKTFSNGNLITFLRDNCDLALGNFGNSEKSKHVLGNKIIEGVAMKAPILTGESTAPHEYFTNNELFYTKNAPEDIASAAFFISNNNINQIKERVNDAYKIFNKDFSIEANQKKLHHVFTNFIN